MTKLTCPSCKKHQVQVRKYKTHYLVNCFNFLCGDLPSVTARTKKIAVKLFAEAQ